MRRHDALVELQTQENLLLHILKVCHPVDVRITVYQIRQVRRQMTAMRREVAMREATMRSVWMVVLVVFVLMLAVMPVNAQDGNEIVIQPEGLVYTIIGAIVGGLLTFAGVYTQLKGRNPSADLKPEDRSGMLGILLVGGWLASKSPGEWDDKQIERLMSGYGFKSPVDNPHPPTPSPLRNEGESSKAQGIPFKSVRREPPPIGDTLEDAARDWGVNVPDELTEG